MFRKLTRAVLIFTIFLSIHNCFHIQAMETQKNSQHESPIDERILRELYAWESPRLLHIKKELLDEKSLEEPADLKKLFEQQNIITDSHIIAFHEEQPWNEKEWQEGHHVLKNRAEVQQKIASKQCSIGELAEQGLLNEYVQKKVSIEELAPLLHNAKAALKHFLLPDGAIHNTQDWIRKPGSLGRLFTYLHLQQTIRKHDLEDISLPKKFLRIEKKATGEYVNHQQAVDLIDSLVKVVVFPSFIAQAKIDYFSTEYKFEILAQKMKNSGLPLNHQAHENLKILTTHAPFDVGHDNIFSDENGDAIIIDTEFKGESANSSCAKLERYLHE